MTPVHHYYHIYADGVWERPVQEHLAALAESGLACYPGFLLNVGVVGTAENLERVQQHLGAERIPWHLAAWQTEGWEQVTLCALARDCHVKDGVVLYGHTKGSHVTSRFNAAWRQRMSHFTITQWRAALDALETCDAYGCHWMELQGNWIFGGNFWWTHMRLLRLLGAPQLANRWQAEGWIGTLRHHIEELRVHDPAPPFPGQIGPPSA